MWAMAELTAQTDSHLGIGRKPNEQRVGEVRDRLSLVRMQPFAWEKKRFLWNHISARSAWSLTSTLRFSTSLAQTNIIIVCKFGSVPAICLREEVIFVKSQKCPYHATFDLDLEHNLDAGSSGNHRVQVWWRSSHFCGRRSDLRKVYRRTDGQTDRQADGRRTPRDCTSSWNELKININNQ